MIIKPTVIDLYHEDTVLSFLQVASDGINRVIHKATEGTTDVDPSYRLRRPQATAAGLIWEAYHFWRPDDAEAQAKNFLKTTMALAGIAPPSAYWLDYEVAGGTPDAIIALMQAVQDATGKPMGLYTTRSLAEALDGEVNEVGADFFRQCPLWLAEPGVTKPRLNAGASEIWPKISLWQYSWSGRIKGVSGKVDLNCVPEA
jgi:lysozyme